MNMKKIISSFCALSLAAASFASLAISASAEGETLLWSDTFDAQATDMIAFNDKAGPVVNNEAIMGIQMSTTNRGGGDRGSWYKILEKETTSDKFLNVGSTFFGDYVQNGRWGHIDFIDADKKPVGFEATADKDVIMDFDLKMKDGNNSGEAIDPVLRVGAFSVANSLTDVIEVKRSEKSDKIANDTWVHARIIVTASGAKVYIEGEEVAENANVKSIAKIGFITPDGVIDYNPTISDNAPAELSFDNVVVYSAPAGQATATSTAPAPITQGAGETTYIYAPKGTVPDGFTAIVENDLNAINIGRYKYADDGGEATDTANMEIDGIQLSVSGGKQNSPTNWTGFSSTEAEKDVVDRYLVANSGQFATANRGPKLTFTKEVAERETVGVQFATRLHKGTGGPAEVIFSGDLVASESKGNLSSPIAMITTDASADSSVYACDNALTKVADGGTNVLEVNDNEWVLVTIKATRPKDKTVTASIAVTRNAGTDDETTTYIFGSESEMVTVQDGKKSGVQTLPFVSFRSGNDTDYGASYSSNDIDNILVYTDTVVEKPETVVKATITNATTVNADVASETAAVVKATQNADGTFAVEIVKGLTAGSNTITWTTAPVAGDKIMVFQSLKSIVPSALTPFVVQ